MAIGVDSLRQDEVGGVGTAVAGIAVAGILAALAAELQRGEARGLADLLGGHLIDGDAGADVGAVGLARLAAGQEGGHGAGVIAAAVAVGPGLVQVRPLRTSRSFLNGASGCSVGGSVVSAPSAVGVQSAMWMPLGT